MQDNTRSDGAGGRQEGSAMPEQFGAAAGGNLFAGIADSPGGEELVEALLVGPGLRIERIVSTGQASPPGFWYDQEQAEWVVLLSGAAEVRFADEPAPRRLSAGDWLHIKAHRRHRVEWTDPTQPSVWLAVHCQACPVPG